MAESVSPYRAVVEPCTRQEADEPREAKRARDARDWWRESALGEKARAEARLASVVAKVEALADEWEAQDAGEWHYVHGPAGDNLDPSKASPAIAVMLAAIQADLRTLIASVGVEQMTPTVTPDEEEPS